MKISEILEAARKKIEREENWTQGKLARNAYDEPVEPTSEDACKFCSIGAIKAVNTERFTASAAITYLQNMLPSDTHVVTFNDIFTGNKKVVRDHHKRVLQLFDKAIEAAKADESEGAKNVSSTPA